MGCQPRQTRQVCIFETVFHNKFKGLTMSSLPELFDICTPREDILQGTLTEADYAADLAQVLKGTAPKEYQDPAVFFSTTHPTRGLCNLLSNVCLRLGGSSAQVASIFRLDTNYGGGKTHALIALAHVARGMRGVTNIDEFLSPDLVPSSPVHVAAFDGENADPVNGHAMGDGIRAYTPWGELAYALGGTSGYELIRNSDEKGIAPGADTIKELFGNQPTLILIDELSIYLRKQGAKDLASAAKQLTAFLTALFKAVESSPNAALVYTLAIGKKDKKASDAYSQENQIIADMMQEAESVSARKATLLDPTEEDETIKVLRRRLFASIDEAGAKQVVDAYVHLWEQYKDSLPSFGLKETHREEFYGGFPLHPAMITTLKEKTSTLGNFQRVRGMLRLLARTISRLWEQRPKDTYAVHLHHIDLSFSPIRQEIITKLGQQAFVPALKADIAAAAEDTPSLAEQIDTACYAGMAPYASCVARSIFFHTLAFNDNLKGATENELRYSILSPGMELSFIGDAIRRFRQESAFLDERPNRPLRFMVEPNLTQMIHQREKQIDPQDIRARLNDTIRTTFSGKIFNLALFPSLANDITDNAETPQLAVMGYEAVSISGNSPKLEVPELLCRLFREKSNDGNLRLNRNNLVFVVADESRVEEMKTLMRRRLALEDMRNPTLQQDLADHQKNQLQERYRKSEQELALGIQQAYRHVFYPSKDKVEDSPVELAHTTIEVQNASANPGAGQNQIIRVLQGANKLRLEGDNPDAPQYIIKRTPLRKGQITTAALRDEYRRDPALAILATESILVKAIRTGIEQGEFVYKNGDLICGKGDPFPQIEISEQAFVLTVISARDQKIWPRPAVQPSGTSSKEETSSATGGTGQPAPSPAPSGGTPTSSGGQAAPSVQDISHEGILKEVLTRIWEDARKAGFSAIGEMQISLYDVQDAFAMLGPIGTLAQCEKKVQMDGSLETRDGSSLSVNFEGTHAAALQIKDFILPQFRAAADKTMTMTISLSFTSGLSLLAASTDEFTAKLTRIGGISAFVRVIAKRRDCDNEQE